MFVKITNVGEVERATENWATLAKMAEDVAAHKGRLQRLSDQFARGYIPLVFGGGALGFLIWYFVIGASFVQGDTIDRGCGIDRDLSVCLWTCDPGCDIACDEPVDGAGRDYQIRTCA